MVPHRIGLEASSFHIYLVEDHDLVRNGIARIIREDAGFKVAGTASTYQEALRHIPILQPNLALLDIDLPDGNGMELAEVLKRECPEVAFAFLSMHQEKPLVEKAMALGAKGYFVKTVDEVEFAQGLKMIAAGKPYFQLNVVAQLFENRNIGLSAGSEKHRLEILSEREKEVLAAIGKGLTSKEIAQALFLSERTVETHRKNIHAKLEVKNLAGLIRFAIKSGLVR